MQNAELTQSFLSILSTYLCMILRVLLHLQGSLPEEQNEGPDGGRYEGKPSMPLNYQYLALCVCVCVWQLKKAKGWGYL